jgi:hypothetical protein
MTALSAGLKCSRTIADDRGQKTEDRIRLVSLGLMSLPTLVEHLNFHKIRREIPLLFSGILKQMNGSQEEFRWKEMLIIFEHY